MPTDKTEHTPGPWSAYDTGIELAILHEDGTEGGVEVASTPTRSIRLRGSIKKRVSATEQDRHNAHLIAAAPDMLDLLYDYHDLLMTTEMEHNGRRIELLNKTQEVINKATSQ